MKYYAHQERLLPRRRSPSSPDRRFGTSQARAIAGPAPYADLGAGRACVFLPIRDASAFARRGRNRPCRRGLRHSRTLYRIGAMSEARRRRGRSRRQRSRGHNTLRRHRADGFDATNSITMGAFTTGGLRRYCSARLSNRRIANLSAQPVG